MVKNKVVPIYRLAIKYFSFSISSNTSKENVEKVVKPPQKPVFKKRFISFA